MFAWSIPSISGMTLIAHSTQVFTVVGVSFHIGSGTSETKVYARAIALCRALFHVAHNVGHKNMRLLDVGGGFPGGSHSSICEVAEVINSSLEEHFPERSVRVISEPGTYFAAAAFTLATMVHSKREVASKESDEDAESHTMYFINDGVFGSFNCVISYLQHVPAEPLIDNGSTPSACSVWGPTCDSVDCVLPRARLPALAVGDWLVFRDMGAYTLPIATRFNGFPAPTVRHVVDARLACVLKELRPLSASQFAADRTGSPSLVPATPPSRALSVHSR